MQRPQELHLFRKNQRLRGKLLIQAKKIWKYVVDFNDPEQIAAQKNASVRSGEGKNIKQNEM